MNKLYLLGVVLFALLLCSNQAFSTQNNSINIAVSASFSGEGADAGLSFERAINIAVSQINNQGGIQGRQIRVDYFDDENNPEKGRLVAQEIVSKNYHAVIGHHYSDVSIAAGQIYKEAQIPVISPASTADRVTIDNDWYFRAIFSNDAQATFIANYINQVYSGEQVKIITGNVEYGLGLRNSLLRTANALGIPADEHANIDPTSDTYFDEILTAAEEIKRSGYDGVLFLATHAPMGVDVVKALRDKGLMNTIFVPDAFAAESFLNGLRSKLPANASVQFYTRNIFVASPLIFDSANQAAQIFFDHFTQKHGHNPDWRAAYAYDTVLLLQEAIGNSFTQINSENIAESRAAIRDALENINSAETAVSGITGLNFFNENGDVIKPVVIGNFTNYGLSSPLTQFTTVPSVSEIFNLEEALNNESIVLFDDTYMYRTDVVFTGLIPRQIREFQPESGTYVLEFDLWLRHQGNTNVSDIEFTNSDEEIVLDEPIYSQQDGVYIYDLYRVSGRFKTNFLVQPPPFRHYHIGTSLRHKRNHRGQLIYVSDLHGMGFLEEESIIEQTNADRLLGHSSDWQAVRISVFSDIDRVSTQGRPEHILKTSSMIPFSTFSYVMEVQRDTITVRGLLPESLLGYMFALSLLGLLMLFLFRKQTPKAVKAIGGIFIVLLFLMAGDQLFTDQLVGILDLKYIYINELVFKVLWWLLPAFLFSRIVEWYIWQGIEEKTERQLPGLVRGIAFLLIMTFAGFGIIAFVLEQRLTSLLATSGLAAMIIGLAIQVNLANIFSGLALNIERPFRVGDWVQIGESIGKVTEINWRTTRIFTLFDNTISIPNSRVTEELVENFNYPRDRHYAGFTLYIDHAHPPEKIIPLLQQAVHITEGFMEDWVVFSDYTDWASEYKCFGAISDYATHFSKKSDLLRSIRKVLKENNISLAVRRQELKMIDEKSDMKTILK